MDRSFSESSALKAEDFRRLGVRPQECRMTVIRRAAARTTKDLGQQQLNSPSEPTEQKLLLATTTAYRLLDPRRRDDSNERVLVGRILPNELQAASRTRFSSESESQLDQDLSPGPDPACPQSAAVAGSVQNRFQPPATQNTVATVLDEHNAVAQRLESESLLRSHQRGRTVRWLRALLREPAFVVGLIMLLVATTFWAWQQPRSNMGFARAVRLDSAANPTPTETATELVDNTEKNLASDVLSDKRSASHSSVDEVGSDDFNINDANEGTSADSDAGDSLATVSSESAAAHADDIADPQRIRLEGVGSPPSESAGASTDQAEIQTDESGLAGEELPWEMINAAWDRFVDAARSIEQVFDQNRELPPSNEFLPDPFEQPFVFDRPKQFDFVEDVPVEAFPVPAKDELANAKERLNVQVPELSSVTSESNAKTVLEQLSRLKSDASPGTPDFWIIYHTAARIGWSTRDITAIRDDLETLAARCDVSMNRLMTDTFVDRYPFVETEFAHQNMLRNGIALLESLIAAESLESCDGVLLTTRRSAEFLAETEAISLLEQYKQAISKMSRLREKANEVVQWPDVNQPSAADAAIAGRYYCLMLRQWDVGFDWLAKGNDPRLSALARSENQFRHHRSITEEASLDVSESFGQEELVDLADRWAAAASRMNGRSADSIRLHALELMREVAGHATGASALTVQLKMEKIESMLPPYVTNYH